MKYAWIAEQSKAFALSEMCDVLAVSISGYRYSRKRQHSTHGFRSPVQFLEHWISEQHQEKQVA